MSLAIDLPSIGHDAKGGIRNDDYSEQSRATGVLNKHFLDRFDTFKKTLRDKSVNGVIQPGSNNRKRLFCCVNVASIRNIDASDESFSVNLRLYLSWQDSLKTFEGLDKIASKASKDSHYNLNPDEVDFMQEHQVFILPNVSFYNATLVKDIDSLPSIRVYGGDFSKQLIVWNRGYQLTCREHFELENFPFDTQTLSIDLRQNDSRSCDVYDLSVHSVLFHVGAMEMSEWRLGQPLIERNSPAHKVTNVKIQVARKPNYYLHNIVYLMIGISSLSLTTFRLESVDVEGRLKIILTLLLTAVAFKFVIGGNLPKVQYNTVMDVFLARNLSFLFAMAYFVSLNSILDEYLLDSWWSKQAISTKFPLQLVWFFCGFSVLFLLNATWLWQANKLHRNQVTPFINKVEGKNWYSCEYGNPFFLDTMKPLLAKRRPSYQLAFSEKGNTASGTKI